MPRTLQDNVKGECISWTRAIPWEDVERGKVLGGSFCIAWDLPGHGNVWSSGRKRVLSAWLWMRFDGVVPGCTPHPLFGISTFPTLFLRWCPVFTDFPFPFLFRWDRTFPVWDAEAEGLLWILIVLQGIERVLEWTLTNRGAHSTSYPFWSSSCVTWAWLLSDMLGLFLAPVL